MKTSLTTGLMGLVLALMVFSCGSKERSATTGWKYNDQKWGGFEKLDYKGQETGPNLVLVVGGTFSMGNTQEDATYEWDNIPRRVTVSSFYMDETEVANIDYREYIYWLQRVFGESYPEIVQSSLPDTLVWREELAYNEPLVETYLRMPAYDNYPVVGVTWEQASEYCKWRTDRVNEAILIDQGVLNPNVEQKDQDNFNTKAYLAGKYEGSVRKNLKDLQTGGERSVRLEDGILLPEYLLPTEAQWEYAALGAQGDLVPKDEILSDRRNYPWSGSSMRYQRRDKYQGRILANFKRSKGDYMGVAGNLNDNAVPTAPVRSYLPNDFGLYNMAGNVNEWVRDVYRPLTSITLSDAEDQDFNPFRGNRFEQLMRDENGELLEVDSMGRLRYEYISEDEAKNRRNYKKGDVYDYMDGDQESQAFYDYSNHTLVNNESRVFKGGGWNDRAYWLSPGTRRHAQQDQADRSIGFRCAMARMGAPNGNGADSGNQFKVKKGRKTKRRF